MDKYAILLDFDGTVEEKNVAITLLEKFAVDDWKRYIEMSARKAISFREAVEKEFECLPTDQKRMTEFVLEQVKVRDGLRELVDFCQSRKYPIEVVSGGLDFYIKAIMETQGLGHVVRHSGTADFQSGDRLRVLYNGGSPVCDFSGTCKCFHAERFRNLGYKTVLVGDGTSDMCASEKVDYVFARRKLLDHCQKKGIAHSPFETFHDVVSVLRRSLP